MAATNNMHCMLSIDECGIFNIAYAGNRGILDKHTRSTWQLYWYLAACQAQCFKANCS